MEIRRPAGLPCRGRVCGSPVGYRWPASPWRPATALRTRTRSTSRSRSRTTPDHRQPERRRRYPVPMTGPAVDPRDLRVSDDERSHVLGVLEKATGRGLIDLAEYQRRSAFVIAARTRAELNATVVDLPGLLIAGRSVEAATAATA